METIDHDVPGRIDDREALWLRVVLTVAWVFCMMLLVLDLRGAYDGRLILLSGVMLGPVCVVAVIQGIVLRGWPRRIASWGLVVLFGILGFLILSFVFIVPPRWFPVAVLWIIAIALWGLGIVWWRWNMRGAVVAWCLLPVAMLLALVGNRGEWNGRVEMIEGGDVALGAGMVWIGEDPDVFALAGMEMPSFRAPRMVFATVGAVESAEYAADRLDWRLAPQRTPGHAVVAHADTSGGPGRSKLHYGMIAVDGTISLDQEVDAHGLVDASTLLMVETGGPWRVFPRLVAPGDPAIGPTGVTFFHRDTGRMLHAADMDHKWVFAADDPERFLCIVRDSVYDEDTNTSTEVLVLEEIDLSREGARTVRARHATPHWAINILAANPESGVFLQPIPAGGAPARTTYPSVEFLDWETGALTVLAQNVNRQNVRIVTAGAALCALLIEDGAWGSRLIAHDGRGEMAAATFHPADMLRDAALSPDGRRVALVIGRGFLPGMLGQIYATQATLVWEFESGRMTEVNAQSIMSGMMGGMPMPGLMEWQRLHWSRDGRRLACLSTGMRPYNTFNQFGGQVLIYHYGEWRGEE